MAVQLRADNSNILRVGSKKFTIEDLQLIHKLYMTEEWILWAIQEAHFDDAKIEEIAVAVKNGQMDLEQTPYDKRATLTYDPSSILLSEFRVGQSSNK